MELPPLLYLIAAALFSGLIAFAMTPPVRALAKHVGAIDIPKDSRRMHTVPIPRLGGIAVFGAFLLTSYLFAAIDQTLLAVWLGGLIIVAMGIIDDIFGMHPFIKLLIQLAAALTVMAQGFRIEYLHILNYYIIFDPRLAVAITLLWIVTLTNAMNLIDGLDGLSCGIAAIASLSLTVLSFLRGDFASALLTAILFGSCIGFLPFNRFPAKIFLGDTGSQLLGFLLAVLTLSGFFKAHVLLSFFAPIMIFALPLFDTTFAFFRRLFTGKNPFKGDRGHLHHRLMDLGYSQPETVSILHAICGIFSVSALLFATESGIKALISLSSGAALLLLYLCLLHPTKQERAEWKKRSNAPKAAESPLPPPTNEIPPVFETVAVPETVNAPQTLVTPQTTPVRETVDVSRTVAVPVIEPIQPAPYASEEATPPQTIDEHADADSNQEESGLILALLEHFSKVPDEDTAPFSEQDTDSADVQTTESADLEAEEEEEEEEVDENENEDQEEAENIEPLPRPLTVSMPTPAFADGTQTEATEDTEIPPQSATIDEESSSIVEAATQKELEQPTVESKPASILDTVVIHPHRLVENEVGTEDEPNEVTPEQYLSFDLNNNPTPLRRRPRPTRSLTRQESPRKPGKEK